MYRYHTLDICKLLFLIAGEIILILFGMILPLNQKEGYGKGLAVAGGIAGDLFVVQSLSVGYEFPLVVVFVDGVLNV